MAESNGTDDELLLRLGRNEASAARELVSRKLPRILALAQRLLGQRGEAEDVAQETLVRAWKQAPHWRPGEARLDTWLHRVALNLCRDRLRSARTRHEQTMDEMPEPPDTAPPPDERLDRLQGAERVAAALARLPARQREALVLHYYQELPQADAAALMDISVDALESLLARARRTLRAQLVDATRPSCPPSSPDTAP
ncbi:RNA polymerase sigma factor [Variovorax sp. JS1663]|uniref:RNA polymerase sigma factor n=1 Tax=Variovorax sp. JS1663 TaxID=1851577 RepID=UPI000B343B69|nr:RNA polymerase sigma factor [Variovorax sp. JS1663]OUL98757.1 RNA polymerase sigma-70 factor [Variovorax sp. JS1663]